MLFYSCLHLNASLHPLIQIVSISVANAATKHEKKLLPACVNSMTHNAPPNECSTMHTSKLKYNSSLSYPSPEMNPVVKAHAAIASIPLLFFSSSIFPRSPSPGMYFAKSFNANGLASSSTDCQYRIEKGRGELTGIPNILHRPQHHLPRWRLLNIEKQQSRQCDSNRSWISAQSFQPL
jgi:hypothetical protein